MMVYVGNVSKFCNVNYLGVKGSKPLSVDGELECVYLAKRGCKKSQELLIKSNISLIIRYAKKFARNNFEIMDYVNEGSSGLLSAINKYDPTVGIRFISFAVWYIKKRMYEYRVSQSGLMKIPVAKHRKNSDIYKVYDNFLKENDRIPTSDELIMISGCHRCDVIDFLAIGEGYIKSYEDMDSNCDDDSHFLEYYQEKSRECLNMDTKDIIKLLENRLTKEEFCIVVGTLGLIDGTPMQLAHLGERMGCSREKIRLMRDKIFLKLRNDKRFLEELSNN